MKKLKNLRIFSGSSLSLDGQQQVRLLFGLVRQQTVRKSSCRLSIVQLSCQEKVQESCERKL
jgi:hypothetical protein